MFPSFALVIAAFITSLFNGEYLLALGLLVFSNAIVSILMQIVIPVVIAIFAVAIFVVVLPFIYLYDLNKNEDDKFLPSLFFSQLKNEITPSFFNKFKKYRSERATDVNTESREADDDAMSNDNWIFHKIIRLKRFVSKRSQQDPDIADVHNKEQLSSDPDMSIRLLIVVVVIFIFSYLF
jgi:hypothetical protein